MSYPLGEAEFLALWGTMAGARDSMAEAHARLQEALDIVSRLGARRHVERLRATLAEVEG